MCFGIPTNWNLNFFSGLPQRIEKSRASFNEFCRALPQKCQEIATWAQDFFQTLVRKNESSPLTPTQSASSTSQTDLTATQSRPTATERSQQGEHTSSSPTSVTATSSIGRRPRHIPYPQFSEVAFTHRFAILSRFLEIAQSNILRVNTAHALCIPRNIIRLANPSIINEEAPVDREELLEQLKEGSTDQTSHNFRIEILRNLRIGAEDSFYIPSDATSIDDPRIMVKHAITTVHSTVATMMEKVHANAIDAITRSHNGYNVPEEMVCSVTDLVALPESNLQITDFQEAEAQSRRPTMEDAHFFTAIKRGHVAAVFDGHGGRTVADYAKAHFTEIFEEQLDEAGDDVRLAFNKTFEILHQGVTQANLSDGCTAVVSFVDHHGRIFTATLGDSEAYLYRKHTDGTTVAIPLSDVRDWCYEREHDDGSKTGDYQRGLIKRKEAGWDNDWPKKDNPKYMRYPQSPPWPSINVSRALGDAYFSDAISQKPKVTVQRLEAGDVLILACDGLFDYSSEEDRLTEVTKGRDGLAQRLVELSLDGQKHGGSDNVTVLSLTIGA